MAGGKEIPEGAGAGYSWLPVPADTDSLDRKDRVMAGHLMEVKQVSFAYEEGKKILKDLNVIIDRGEWIAVIGNNGSGKTTFFHYLKGLLPRHQGEVFLHGERIL